MDPKKVDPKWSEHFAMISRGFVEEFGLRLSRNAWVLYQGLSTFYNRKQRRAFPPLAHLYAVCPLSRFSRSRAMLELVDALLVEVWSESVGRRERRFYRLLFVDAKGHHVSTRQQHTAEELRELERAGSLPPGFEWLKSSYSRIERRAEE
jgi:hypothetical protein